jgi:hypothetical protein
MGSEVGATNLESVKKASACCAPKLSGKKKGKGTRRKIVTKR